VHGSVDGIQGGKNLYGFFLENAPGKKKKKNSAKAEQEFNVYLQNGNEKVQAHALVELNHPAVTDSGGKLPVPGNLPRPLRLLLLQSKQARPVRQTIIVAASIRIVALVEQLQVARVDRHRLVIHRLDEVAMANIVGPGSAAVGLAGERGALGGGVGGPGASEAGGGEGAEEAAGRALGLDEHEVLVEALEGVDLHGFEEVARAVAHDDGTGGAEAAGEVGEGHAGAVDFAVVAGEEEVHVGGVGDERLVDGAGAGAGDGAGEEGMGGAPAGGVGGVGRGAVGEGGGVPLVGEDPDALGSKVEEGWGDGVEGHGVLAGGAELGEVGDGAEAHAAVLGAGVVVGGVDDVFAVVDGGGEVFEAGPAGLGVGECIGRRPFVGGGQVALC